MEAKFRLLMTIISTAWHCKNSHFMGPIYSYWHPTSHWFGHSYVLVHPVLTNICLSDSSIPTMGPAGPTEISVHFYHTAWCHTSRSNNLNGQDLKFSQLCCWRFKSSGILCHVDYQLNGMISQKTWISSLQNQCLENLKSHKRMKLFKKISENILSCNTHNSNLFNIASIKIMIITDGMESN
jgi:hypothetical protein